MKCPYCGKNAQYAPNEEFYGKRYGKSYMAYFCKPCNAYVGTHENSTRPLGTMANKELRDKRIETHTLFDPLWKLGSMSRKEAYNMLSKRLGRSVHIAQSNLE